MIHRRPCSRCCLVALVAILAHASGYAVTDTLIQDVLLGFSNVGIQQSGVTVAVEFQSDDERIVTRLALLSGERIIRDEIYDRDVSATEWLGLVPLVDSAGQPLPAGEYTIAAFTEEGAFLAAITVVEDIESYVETTGSPVTVTVRSTGSALRVFRYATTEDEERSIHLRNGDAILIALTGNPTTGYEWFDATRNLFPVLEPIEGRTYLPDPSAPDIVGSGGRFLFRFRAFTVGSQVLRFDYARPWETAAPEQQVLFAIDVI